MQMGAWGVLTWPGGRFVPASGNHFLCTPGKHLLAAGKDWISLQHKKTDIICRVTCRRKCGGMACEIQILIIFSGFLMCWLEPWLWAQPESLGHPCSEVYEGESWKELVLGLMAGLGRNSPSREQEGSLIHLSWLVQAVLPAWSDVPAPKHFAESFVGFLTLAGCDECSLRLLPPCPAPFSATQSASRRDCLGYPGLGWGRTFCRSTFPARDPRVLPSPPLLMPSSLPWPGFHWR